MICRRSARSPTAVDSCSVVLLLTPFCIFQEGSDQAGIFRYTITPKSKVSVFEPKPLPPATEFMNMRGTMMGAVMKNNLTKLPQNKMGSTVWEVPQLIKRH